MSKFRSHLWYLSPEAAALGFFDDNVPVVAKIRMVEALESSFSDSGDEIPKRFSLLPKDILNFFVNIGLEDYIFYESKNLFQRLKIPIFSSRIQLTGKVIRHMKKERRFQ